MSRMLSFLLLVVGGMFLSVMLLRTMELVSISVAIFAGVGVLWLLVRTARRPQTAPHQVSLVAGARSDVLALIPWITTDDLRRWHAHAPPDTLAPTAITDRLPVVADTHTITPSRSVSDPFITVELPDTAECE